MFADTALPPTNIHLAQVSKNVLTFQWDSICTDLGYKIIAMNCGVCPNTTLGKSITCVVSNQLPNDSVCTLSVELNSVCGFQTGIGNESNAIMAILKGIIILLPILYSTVHHNSQLPRRSARANIIY